MIASTVFASSFCSHGSFLLFASNVFGNSVITDAKLRLPLRLLIIQLVHEETNRTIKVSEHIRLDTRPGSAKWQVRVKLADGSWHEFSIKTESIKRAREVTMKFFYTSEDHLKDSLPQSTRKFRRVAEFAQDRMQEKLRSGSGHIHLQRLHHT